MPEERQAKVEWEVDSDFVEHIVAINAARVGTERALRVAMGEAARLLASFKKDEEKVWLDLMSKLGITADAGCLEYDSIKKVVRQLSEEEMAEKHHRE